MAHSVCKITIKHTLHFKSCRDHPHILFQDISQAIQSGVLVLLIIIIFIQKSERVKCSAPVDHFKPFPELILVILICTHEHTTHSGHLDNFNQRLIDQTLNRSLELFISCYFINNMAAFRITPTLEHTPFNKWGSKTMLISQNIIVVEFNCMTICESHVIILRLPKIDVAHLINCFLGGSHSIPTIRYIHSHCLGPFYLIDVHWILVFLILDIIEHQTCNRTTEQRTPFKQLDQIRSIII